jgi:hypothetical protein
MAQRRYLRLVRLAWDLHEIGVASVVDLSRGGEPAVLISGGSDRFKITAGQRDGHWIYIWGRGRAQWEWADAEDVARQIAERVIGCT